MKWTDSTSILEEVYSAHDSDLKDSSPTHEYAFWAPATNSAYDITSGVHTNAHEDAFSAPRTNVRLVAVFGAFKVPRVHSCALHLHYPLG